MFLSAAKHLELSCWLIVSLGAVFTMARFSEAFLILRAQNVGLSVGLVPLVLIIMNVVYAMSWRGRTTDGAVAAGGPSC